MDTLCAIIADDHPKTSNVLKAMCNAVNGLDMRGVARSEQMLITKTRSMQPDIVFLNPQPEMGGIEIIDTLKRMNPEITIIIAYPKTSRTDFLVTALEMGAYECIEAPENETIRQFNELRRHMMTIVGLLRSRKRFFNKQAPDHSSRFFMPPEHPEHPIQPVRKNVGVICIAASTGGPEILSRIFSILPKGLKAPILLVQHIPEYMTGFFAQSLNHKSELDVIEAKSEDRILPSRVYLAPGGHHMVVSKPDPNGQRYIKLSQNAQVNSVRPSADVLFESVAQSYHENVLAIVLTGMGEDGRHGIAELKKHARCICVTQEAATCVVYGMPRAVDEAGLSDERLDPLRIAQKIVMCAK
jgi:two-component system chemotaxis response regulator CheB